MSQLALTTTISINSLPLSGLANVIASPLSRPMKKFYLEIQTDFVLPIVIRIAIASLGIALIPSLTAHVNAIPFSYLYSTSEILPFACLNSNFVFMFFYFCNLKKCIIFVLISNAKIHDFPKLPK